MNYEEMSNYEEIENEDIKKVIEDMVEIIGVSFGTLDFRTALEIMKVAELKKMNEHLDEINKRLYHIRD